jgi:hypothetical protein
MNPRTGWIALACALWAAVFGAGAARALNWESTNGPYGGYIN